MDPFKKHAIKIAKDSMRMTCAGCRIMGGPDHAAAYYTLSAYGIQARKDVAADCTCRVNGGPLLTEVLGITKTEGK